MKGESIERESNRKIIGCFFFFPFHKMRWLSIAVLNAMGYSSVVHQVIKIKINSIS